VASELDFRHVSAADGDGAAIIAAMVEEIRELYGGLDLNAPDMPTAGAADLGPPGGTFLVGYREGTPVCGGGIKRLADGECEIKRMYVIPAVRRQGVARALLRALENAARGWVTTSRGWTPDLGSRRPADYMNPKATCRSRISTATQWPRSSVRRS